MKKPTVKYGKGEIGRVKIVEDFLPSRDKRVLREKSVHQLTGEQVAEVQFRRADKNAPKLTLEEFKERLSWRLDK